jgi:hypothetical protein
MNDRRRIERVRRAAGRLGEFAARLDSTVGDSTLLGRMRDAQGGTQAQRFDAQRSGPTVPDPTAAAALRGADPATRDLVRLDRICNRLVALIEEAWDIADRYPPPRSATETDRLALERENSRGEDGCQNCSRIEGERGGPRWSPVHSGITWPTDVGGRLAEPMLLCRWCYGRVAEWGRVPSPSELQRHHRGQKVPWPADVPRPA